jgi:RHS repeat-associated protein
MPPSSLTNPLPTLYAWSLGYEPNGNIGYAYDSVNGSWAYLYDSLNRLEAAGTNNGVGLQWQYDSFGNMLEQTATGAGGVSTQRTFSANNRDVGACYDAAGNQTQDSGCNNPAEYTYDAENRLASSSWGTIGYIYDAEGKRVGKTTGGTLSNVYLYDDSGRVVTEMDGNSTVLRREIYAGGRHLTTYQGSDALLATPANLAYVMSDWLGAERALTTSTGALCQVTTSQPFGDNQQANGNCLPRTSSSTFFTGKERDTESGLDYFGARYNSSNMGRFMSPDP